MKRYGRRPFAADEVYFAVNMNSAVPDREWGPLAASDQEFNEGSYISRVDVRFPEKLSPPNA